ncbi:CDF family Co(II)/Ni(II) efflux transporter DmeF [Myxococcota bacterium]|nr:CDF family Co(II)/Ni(II) efflux transporter DmeF [Myxococcota bacterium]
MVALTAVVMVAELVVGYRSGSMALTADGWHMGTHAGAIGLAAFSYWFARTRARQRRYAFGTGKVYALAGYTSALLLGAVALEMLVHSGERLLAPQPVRWAEALPVAVLGLVVNWVSAVLLHPGGEGHGRGEERGHGHEHGQEHEHEHEHGHGHGHGHGREHEQEHEHGRGAFYDHNLGAAYLHVLADALTSVLAIAALVAGRYAGWVALDPLVGIVGGALILRWAYGLARGAARQLLDVVPEPGIEEEIRSRLEAMDDARVADLHLWELGPGRRGVIVTLVTGHPRPAAEYRAAVLEVAAVHHLTVEVHRCPNHPEAGAAGGPC